MRKKSFALLMLLCLLVAPLLMGLPSVKASQTLSYNIATNNYGVSVSPSLGNFTASFTLSSAVFDASKTTDVSLLDSIGV